MKALHRIGKSWLLVCAAVSLMAISAGTARAAKLGHPTYSAAASTTAQRQVNLICDPVGAETGSTSTMYNPSVTGLDTITAEPGFEITEVDVLISNSEGPPSVQQFPNLPTGTTSVVITPESEEDDVLTSALAAVASSTYYTPALEGPEAGAVQVFWAPIGTVTTPPVTIGVATAANVSSSSFRFPFPFPFPGTDVNTHIITFDEVVTTGQASFTNYANGNSAFPLYFAVNDGYSGPGFSYTAQQIAAATATVNLSPPRFCPFPFPIILPRCLGW